MRHQNNKSKFINQDDYSSKLLKLKLKIRKIANFKKMSVFYNEYWPS